jgi:hypothetical protein
MKLAKLSLAAIVVAGLASSSFAADTLADAFKNGKVSGAVQAYYWTKDNGTTNADIFTTGIDLSYQTASFYGLAFKATFQSSSAPFADSDAKTVFASDMWGSGAVLSEAFVSYSIGKTTALVGRMYLDTPLVASSGSRMTKQSFQGAAVINTDLPNTTLIAGYVDKYQARTDGNGNIGKFKKEFNTGSGYADGVRVNDGAYELAAINKSIPGLTLTAAYANVVNIIQVAYAEAAYEGKAGKFAYGLAAQYYYNNADDSIVTEDNNLVGVKASLGYDAFGAYVAYSKVNNKAGTVGGVVSGLGGGADLAYTGSPIMSDSYANDTEAYKVGATYAIMKNANVGLSYTNNEIDSTNYKAGFTAVEADYAFEGALKGLSAAFIYEDGSKDANGKDAMRLNVNYKF